METSAYWRCAMLVVLAGLAPMARLAAQTTEAAMPTGCWHFEPADGDSAARPLTLTPPFARFTANPARVGDGAVMQRLDARGRWLDSLERVVLSTWRPTPDGDSIRVVFSLGLANSVYVLAWRPRGASAQADTLTGRAVEWFDYGPRLVPRGAARAVRSACPA